MNPTSNAWKINWKMSIYFGSIHLLALYFIYWILFLDQNLTNGQLMKHYIMLVIFTYLSVFGVSIAAHRFFSHRSFKARLPLRIVLMLLQTMSFQSHLVWWCRNHRLHHKYSDTDADPHNAKRGLFFSHIGWLLITKHPEVHLKGSKIDISDLLADPVVRFQKRFYWPLALLVSAVLPTYTTYLVTGSSLWLCFLISVIFRQVIIVNETFTINSIAHKFGYRAYDKNILPVENTLTDYLTLGDGHHNYHHTFPNDYSSSEHGWASSFSISTAIIDLCAWLGLAYDLKKPSDKFIEDRVKRTGDEYLRKSRQIKPKIIDYLLGLFVSQGLATVLFSIRMIKNL